MPITALKTFVVGNPPPHFGGRYFVFLKLVTDAGIEGVGEVVEVAGALGEAQAVDPVVSADHQHQVPQPADGEQRGDHPSSLRRLVRASRS